MATFGGKLRALMAERQISQRKLAKLVPCDDGHLSKIANGRKRPSPELAARLDDLLDARGALAALCPRRPPRQEPEDVAGQVGVPLGLAGDHPLGLDGRPADAAFVASVRHTSQALIRLDTEHGGNDLLPMALRAFRAAHDRLGAGAYVPAVERDLIAAAGEAGEVAAWLAYDADRQDVSRWVVHEALMLSRQAGDRDMELFELTHLAMQAVHQHRPAEAVRITRGLLGTRLPPRGAALLTIREGRALAQLGRAGEAFAALGRARSALLDGVTARDPSWTWWVTDAEVLWHTGMAHADLGEWEAAVPLLREAAELRVGYRRARYNDLAHLLNALTHVGAWREVEPVLAEVAGIMPEVNSARTTNLLRRVASRIVCADAPSTVVDMAGAVRRHLRREVA
ncbi:helix-turn-helix domain-containing protein [Actinomadura formosensis]|uniref:helix-turn-helix domain-containing protein n=1 Tax=Actinomadura formosensis TaxID=60706 RepID=UPI00082BC77E|nr:helix-turn-helix transcriptional regulator [Actinomadura formosensis]